MKVLDLSRPATVADVIGWSVVVPLLAWTALMVPTASGLPANFEAALREFDLPRSALTTFFLSIGPAGITALFAVLALLPVGILLVGRRGWIKVCTPMACACTAAVLYLNLVESCLAPVLQAANSMK